MGSYVPIPAAPPARRRAGHDRVVACSSASAYRSDGSGELGGEKCRHVASY